ncbi:two-component response regulator [hydrothermal vent metagenome]|uniref:Two-component response regulator n=1 Tax=hydrothermal vent metagenome TaxID=652676 RepID=A0A1W1D4Q4_9ZZZZ
MEKKKYKILVTDDVHDNLTIVDKILNSAGYDVTLAEDGLSTLAIVLEKEFDLILLDIMMPGMSGIEVCTQLKQDPKTKNIPIIFLTANADRDTLIKAYEAGGSDYLKKPFFKEELLARVKARLEISDYERNLENKVKQRTKEIAQTQLELMYVLGSLVEGRSKETYAHLKRVSEFTYKLAKLYGMEEEEAVRLKNASTLHDIGKLKIDKAILEKTTPLTKAEETELKKHAMYGSRMLRNYKLPMLDTAIIVAEQHHENYDGTGYPNRLKGENISIYARIVTIADTFDELSMKKIGDRHCTREEMISFMRDKQGKMFDPTLVNLFFKHIEEFFAIYDMEIDTRDLENIIEVEAPKENGMMGWIRKKF